MILETKNLILRPLTLKDAPDIFALNADWEVLKYTGDVPFDSLDGALLMIQRVIETQYNVDGYGRLAVILKKTNQFAGWCGLRCRKEPEIFTEIGYRLIRQFWGQGIATEAAQACIAQGFQHFDLKKIVGIAMPQNIASTRVLEKCGLHYVKPYIIEGHPVVWYEKYATH
jgi:[ribosomal protein S5]-alanine N-acetyltransferase